MEIMKQTTVEAFPLSQGNVRHGKTEMNSGHLAE
jgi:hypothetical protein